MDFVDGSCSVIGRPEKRPCVTAITSRLYRPQYTNQSLGNVLQEATMTAALKKTGTRFARWFKAFREKNRPASRWYEHDYF